MLQVFKYGLRPGKNAVVMPEDAEILTAQLQFNELQVWALVNAEKKVTERYFLVTGTGHFIDESKLKYISTFQTDGGKYIFHVFEILN